MKTILFVTTALALASQIAAQGQCVPPSRLGSQTPFRSTHYWSAPGQVNTLFPPAASIPQALPAGYRGYQFVFDLQANAAVTVSQIDVQSLDDGDIRFNWGVSPGQPGGPGLVGQNAAVNVYTTTSATSWNGLANNLSAWTLVGTGTLTVAGRYEHSPIVFATPFTLPVGSYGVTIEVGPVTAPVAGLMSYMAPPYAMHPVALLPAFAPGMPTTARDQFLSITNLNLTKQAFDLPPNPLDPAVPVFELHYSVAPQSGYTTRYGSGCYDAPRAFYETFTSPAAFDLANTTVRMQPAGTDYFVQPVAGTPAWFTPVSTPLRNVSNAVLGDDDRTGALPLGFQFPYAGRTTSSIVVTTNGQIYLDPANSGNQRTRFESLGVAGFAEGQPNLAPMWGDLNPSAATGSGSMHFDVDLAAPVPVAYVTWLAVQEFRVTGSTNTFQVALFADGSVEFRYGACSVGTRPTLVGFTAGYGRDPGAQDLSASVFFTGNGAMPPQLDMDTRPILGTTPNLVTRELPANAIGAVFIGGPHAAGVLPGMPGCAQQVSPIGALFFVASGTAGASPLPIPNAAALMGLVATAQTLVAAPGANAAGLTVSNPLCIRIGQ